jgi:hypothetical protein
MNSRFARLLTLVLAAIQFATPAIASVAEGDFARRVVDPRAHVEEHGQKDCVPPHGADCAICRYLVDNVGHAELPAVLPVFAAVRTPAVVRESFGSGVERQGFDARGPPATAG